MSDGQGEAIFTCKFPGCTRQYASTDGVRKHCRKSHPEWLREVDLDKGNLSCRWAAYCTRETITETHDPRTTPVGSKRARELLAQGGELPTVSDSVVSAALNKAQGGGSRPSILSFAESSSSRSAASFARDDEPPPAARPSVRPSLPAHAVAMDGKSALVPLRAEAPAAVSSQAASSSSSDNMMPPEMIALPGELNTPLPVNVSALTPNAQARARLGEIADSESVCLQGGTAHLPASPVVDARDVAAHALQASRGANSFFDHWGMPPLKRGMSLADTRETAAQQALQAASQQTEADDAAPHDSPAFLDSFLA